MSWFCDDAIQLANAVRRPVDLPDWGGVMLGAGGVSTCRKAGVTDAPGLEVLPQWIDEVYS